MPIQFGNEHICGPYPTYPYNGGGLVTIVTINENKKGGHVTALFCDII
jgi:hypothetical protein